MPVPQLLISPRLQAPHAFTTRHAGHSRGIFSTLSFGNPSELSGDHRDTPATIRSNFELVLAELGCARREVVEVHQVHGSDVHTVRAGSPTHETSHDTKADALVTDDPARVLAIRVADCAPVLMASSDGRVVGAAHAGWRGVIAGVIPNTIAAMRALGSGEIAAAIGPCISALHFEVGPEVAAEFERVFGKGTPTVRPRAGQRPMVDLKLAIRIQLEAAVVSAVDTFPHCTFADRERFFSHRRDRGKTGRMIGIIGPNNHP